MIKLYREDPNFYNRLKEIKFNAISETSRWSGPYLVTTYVMSNGEIWEHWNDLDYGVSYSLEQIA